MAIFQRYFLTVITKTQPLQTHSSASGFLSRSIIPESCPERQVSVKFFRLHLFSVFPLRMMHGQPVQQLPQLVFILCTKNLSTFTAKTGSHFAINDGIACRSWSRYHDSTMACFFSLPVPCRTRRCILLCLSAICGGDAGFDNQLQERHVIKGRNLPRRTRLDIRVDEMPHVGRVGFDVNGLAACFADDLPQLEAAVVIRLVSAAL